MSESIVDVINRRFISGNSVSVERVHVNLNEWNALLQQLEQAEAKREFAESERDGFIEQLEQAEARVAWFEDWRERFRKSCNGSPDAYLLRKQAEAVEAATKACEIKSATDDSKCYADALREQAQRLRTQANEQESNQ